MVMLVYFGLLRPCFSSAFYIFSSSNTFTDIIMSMKNTENNRRKLLKSAATGVGVFGAVKMMPESWSKPIVNAVSLPAHAETTDTESGSGDADKEVRADQINSAKIDYDIV